ncbi:hypothetical protein [Natronosalvus vescus]|nr:hypothetical protein [Natronosalvus vescus]
MSSDSGRAYEALFTKDGQLEIREHDQPERWIATDSPVECHR